METNPSLNLLFELAGKALSLFILYRITLCHFPLPNGQKAPAPHDPPMVAPAAQALPLSGTFQFKGFPWALVSV